MFMNEVILKIIVCYLSTLLFALFGKSLGFFVSSLLMAVTSSIFLTALAIVFPRYWLYSWKSVWAARGLLEKGLLFGRRKKIMQIPLAEAAHKDFQVW